MIVDDLGWSLMILRNYDFLMILPDFVKCTTWRRVLRTPLPLPEGVPQVDVSEAISLCWRTMPLRGLGPKCGPGRPLRVDCAPGFREQS